MDGRLHQTTGVAPGRNVIAILPGSDPKLRNEFVVQDTPATTLALMSMAVDVARWYSPHIRRTPESIGADYAELGLRLVTGR